MPPGGLTRGLVAYFTVCGPISRRQSEPARIHHRVTPRNNLLDHNELLSKPSYLFISPRPPPSPPLFRSLPLTIRLPASEPTLCELPFATWQALGFPKPRKSLPLWGRAFIFLLGNGEKFRKAMPRASRSNVERPDRSSSILPGLIKRREY